MALLTKINVTCTWCCPIKIGFPFNLAHTRASPDYVSVSSTIPFNFTLAKALIDVTLLSFPIMWNRSYRWELQAFQPGSLPSTDKIKSHRTINEYLRLYLILPKILRHYTYETWVKILWPVFCKSLTYFHGWLGTSFQIRLILLIGILVINFLLVCLLKYCNNAVPYYYTYYILFYCGKNI